MKVYDACRTEEKAAWIRAWNDWNVREPHAHPAYALAFLREGERALCAVGDGVLMPFVQKPLSPPGERGRGEGAKGICDLVTPYGYGGPFQTGSGDPERFWDAFEAWAEQNGAVSLFARLPLTNAPEFRGETLDLMPNIVVDVTREDRWMDYDGKVRRNVKKAQAAGIEIVEDPHGDRLDEFMRIYAMTMDRRGAEDGYRFDDSFYRAMFEIPGTTLFHALKDGQVVSSELVLAGPTSAYFFLGGTDAAFYGDRPNDLLKHTILEALSARGLKRYVLGGGYGDDDGIFRYKRSFAPNGIETYRVGRRTFDPQTSDILLEMRRAQEAGWTPRAGFFPAYRAPKGPQALACQGALGFSAAKNPIDEPPLPHA